MANTALSNFHVNSLEKRRLKLPPIEAKFAVNKLHRNSSSQSRLIFNSIGENVDGSGATAGFEISSTSNTNDRESLQFSFTQVYPVLPPIGEKINISTSFGAVTGKINLPTAPPGHERDKEKFKLRQVTVTKSSFEAKNDDWDATEKAVATISDNPLETTSSTQHYLISERPGGFELIATPHERVEEIKQTTLTSDVRYANVNVNTESLRDANIDTGVDSVWTQFIAIPDDLVPYADVYPPSPPPEARRAKIAVEKAREALVQENTFRISYLEDMGCERRNATCSELDNTLDNAVQLLRDLFLRKTMEDLCMLW